jgi:Fe-S cluster assembly ATPase SufC
MDLAVFAALQDVAESRISRPFSLKVFDEAADALDARGTECFGEWIRGQARARGSAFLITHNTALSSMIVPDREWVVVLDKHGSRIVF